METVNIEYDGHIAIVQLNRPKAHAMNHLLLSELAEAFTKLADADYIKAAILTGSGSIFSAGLDLFELYEYDEEGMNRLWEALNRMMISLVSFPKPLVAAINGHAPAGGCVMALCCDYRIMTDGNARIGLNEVPVGIIVPKPIVELARFVLGDRRAMNMFLNGTLFLPDEAQAFGLVDENCAPEKLVQVAKTRISQWLKYNEGAWQGTKKFLKEPLLEKLNMSMAEGYSDTNRHWWSSSTRTAMGKQIESMRKK